MDGRVGDIDGRAHVFKARFGDGRVGREGLASQQERPLHPAHRLLTPQRYRGTSLIRNCPPPRTLQ